MQVIVKANKNVNTHYGNVPLEAKEGETLTLSSGDAEIALATGDFEFVKQVSESETEKEVIEAEKSQIEVKRAELDKKSHDELFEMAKSFDENVKKSMTKSQFIDVILKPRAAVVPLNTPEDGEGE